MDAGLFQIDPSTGALSFIAAPNFEAPSDAGGNNVYDVTVQVSDGNGGIDTQAIAITVTNAIGSTINGTNQAESLTGTGEEDFLYWLGGADKMSGGGGNDSLAGGLGADTMTGGGGGGKFFFFTASGGTPAPSDIL